MDASIGLSTLHKANECFGGPGDYCGRETLFDEFWRGGELAMMLGPAGSGKSLLAVQIADALARGREMDGFVMPFWRRQKVLYVDLALSDRQFGERYSYYSPNARLPKTYKFPENLYRDRPKAPEDLCEWLEAVLRGNRFDAVIIDDLSAMKRTHDGVRETLAVMRRLKKLCVESGVAILAITACDPPRPGRMVSERDMGRSRVLCGVADGVFALGPRADGGNGQCLIQLRSRNANIFWTERNAPVGSIERLENGMLGFRFDKRFQPYIDDATFDLINRIRAMRETGKTFKAIAEELSISKTRAFELNGKWIPSMEEREEEKEEFEEYDDEEDDKFDDEEEEGFDEDEDEEEDETELSEAKNITPAKTGITQSSSTVEDPPYAVGISPLLHGPERVSVYDLKLGFNGSGEEIFIEAEDNGTGRQKVWYKFDRNGIKVKSVRDSLGITSTRLGPTEFL